MKVKVWFVRPSVRPPVHSIGRLAGVLEGVLRRKQTLAGIHLNEGPNEDFERCQSRVSVDLWNAVGALRVSSWGSWVAQKSPLLRQWWRSDEEEAPEEPVGLLPEKQLSD